AGWANDWLMHVTGDEVSTDVAIVWGALKHEDYYYASYKAGNAGGRDTLNRYYNDPSQDWLRATYADAGNWNSLSIESGEVKGFDDKMASMLFVVAQKGG